MNRVFYFQGVMERYRKDHGDIINRCYKIAADLWSRDIKSVSDSCIEYRNMINKQVGLRYIDVIDKIIKDNWNNWTEEMLNDDLIWKE